MAGSERRGPGLAARRAAAWEVSESEPESEPEPRGSGAAAAGSPPAAGPAERPRRRRAPGEAAARRRERERRKEQEALEKRRRREAAAAWRLLRPDRCLRLMEVCADPGGRRGPGEAEPAGGSGGARLYLAAAARLAALSPGV